MKNYLISKKYNNWCKRSRKRCSFYQTRINVTICNSNELEELKSKKMLTKQRIKLKTKNSERVLDIPDYLFEVILEERKKYEKNKRRRINDKNNPFLDQGYVCCSTYGKPRSKIGRAHV